MLQTLPVKNVINLQSVTEDSVERRNFLLSFAGAFQSEFFLVEVDSRSRFLGGPLCRRVFDFLPTRIPGIHLQLCPKFDRILVRPANHPECFESRMKYLLLPHVTLRPNKRFYSNHWLPSAAEI